MNRRTKCGSSTRAVLAVVLAVVQVACSTNRASVEADTKRIQVDAALLTWDGVEMPTELFAFRSSSEAERTIRCIVNEVGLKQNFDVVAASIASAAAATLPPGCGNITVPCERVLLYNPQFMLGLRSQTENSWSGVSVMAHEIGHHLNGHTITPGGSTPVGELDADNFSGWGDAKARSFAAGCPGGV